MCESERDCVIQNTLLLFCYNMNHAEVSGLLIFVPRVKTKREEEVRYYTAHKTITQNLPENCRCATTITSIKTRLKKYIISVLNVFKFHFKMHFCCNIIVACNVLLYSTKQCVLECAV